MDLGKIGGLSNSVHSTEGDDVRLTFVLGGHDISQDVHSPLGTEYLDQTLLHTGLHQTLNTWREGGGGERERESSHVHCHHILTSECSDHFPIQFSSHRVTQLLGNPQGNVLSDEVVLHLVQGWGHGLSGDGLTSCQGLEEGEHTTTTTARREREEERFSFSNLENASSWYIVLTSSCGSYQTYDSMMTHVTILLAFSRYIFILKKNNIKETYF